MSRWTDEAVAAATDGSDWSEFHLAFPQYSKDAWRRRQRRQAVEPEVWTSVRIDRAIANNVKLARQVIRLRHSIEADDELADALPRIKAVLAEQVHAGQVTGLTYDELRQLIYGQ